MSATKRKTLATQQLLSALAGTDQTAVITAALELVTERLAWDTSLRQSFRQKYEELVALVTAKNKADLGPIPAPINPRGLGQYNPYGKFDPYELLSEYGHDQLRAVLMRATQRDLREAVDIVQSRRPGIKPASRSRKDDMIDYIVAQVAGPGY